MDPRYSEHGPTVQGLPSTQPQPKKKLSHTVKAVVSAPIDGAYVPIPSRRAIKRKRRKLFGLL